MNHYTQAVADEEPDILNLEADYSFRDRHAVLSFLRDNLFLQDLLAEASQKIRDYFGSDAKLTLEMFRDPEDPVAAELLVRIRTSLMPSVARPRLHSLDDEWWLDASLRSHCKMNIVLERC